MINGAVPPLERGLAVATHLSGLAGYVIPFGGAIVPIIIWIVKNESIVISGIAKQALLLNVIVFLAFGLGVILFLTIILIPVAVLLWLAACLAGIALPIIGAVKASDGEYYRYPFVGSLVG
jgi:uncharacterized protein